MSHWCDLHKRGGNGPCEICASIERVRERDAFFASWVKAASEAGWYGPKPAQPVNGAQDVEETQ